MIHKETTAYNSSTKESSYCLEDQRRLQCRTTDELEPETGQGGPGERVDADNGCTDREWQGLLHDRVFVYGTGEVLEAKHIS